MDDLTAAPVADLPTLVRSAPTGSPVTALPAPAECAERRLRGNPYLALKNVWCECRDGVLTLRGCLPSYYLKQVAQEAVTPVAGGLRIRNEIEVVAPSRRSD